MALLEHGGTRVSIPVGEVLLGSDAACQIRLTGSGLLPKHAVLQGLADGQVVIRKASPQADVLINGVRLGAEPTPLLHGDKVEVGGHELTFVDERRSGSTQYVQAMGVAQAKERAEGKGRPTGNTGGRVVCLTDGREYQITGSSLVFGREAGCDVVVPGKDVSRRHAEIVSTPKGYLLVDSSTNGTFVNEGRVEGQRILARADVIRIGDESFRFYADVAATAPAPAPPPPLPPPPATVPPPAPPSAASAPASPAAAAASREGGGEPRLRNTAFGVPVPPPPPTARASAPLATFLVKTGALKGQRVPIRTPVVNFGRADYNDFMIPDESVSTTHAKLQRREGIWVLIDLDSTNGTFVDGQRIKGEAPLAPGASVRFGDVQLVFDPTDDAVGVAKGGGTRLLEVMKPTAPPPKPAPVPAPAPAAKPKAKPKPAAAASPSSPAPQKKGKGCGSSAVALVLGLAALVYWILV